MMIVIATPMMNPVTTDLVRKSEMNPSRARPAATSMTPDGQGQGRGECEIGRWVAAGEIRDD